MEVYVCWIEIAYSLMWTFIVPVVHECLMGWVDPSFVDVRFMESFDLADRAWSPYACNDMLDAVSTAILRELRDAASCGIELGSTIRQYLIRLPVLFHGFFQELDGMLGCGVMVDS